MNTNAENAPDRLLTESELFAHFLQMTVVASSNVGADDHYVPDHMFNQGESEAAVEFERIVRETLEYEDQPESFLCQLVEELGNFLEAFQRINRDFGLLKRRSEVWTIDEPEEDASDELWDAHNNSVRYRLT